MNLAQIICFSYPSQCNHAMIITINVYTHVLQDNFDNAFLSTIKIAMTIISKNNGNDIESSK